MKGARQKIFTKLLYAQSRSKSFSTQSGPFYHSEVALREPRRLNGIPSYVSLEYWLCLRCWL